MFFPHIETSCWNDSEELPSPITDESLESVFCGVAPPHNWLDALEYGSIIYIPSYAEQFTFTRVGLCSMSPVAKAITLPDITPDDDSLDSWKVALKQAGAMVIRNGVYELTRDTILVSVRQKGVPNPQYFSYNWTNILPDELDEVESIGLVYRHFDSSSFNHTRYDEMEVTMITRDEDGNLTLDVDMLQYLYVGHSGMDAVYYTKSFMSNIVGLQVENENYPEIRELSTRERVLDCVNHPSEGLATIRLVPPTGDVREYNMPLSYLDYAMETVCHTYTSNTEFSIKLQVQVGNPDEIMHVDETIETGLPSVKLMKGKCSDAIINTLKHQFPNNWITYYIEDKINNATVLSPDSNVEVFHSVKGDYPSVDELCKQISDDASPKKETEIDTKKISDTTDSKSKADTKAGEKTITHSKDKPTERKSISKPISMTDTTKSFEEIIDSAKKTTKDRPKTKETPKKIKSTRSSREVIL